MTRGAMTSLIRRLASTRSGETDAVATKYDAGRQITMVLEDGQWVASYDSSTLLHSKKADIETGEDQKSE
jgi:hypothetical protein